MVDLSLAAFTAIASGDVRASRVLPDVPPEAVPVNVRQGQAAQHIVAAELLMLGIDVSIAAESLRYDLIADVHGRLLKLQVKSTHTTQRGRYKFHVSGGKRKNGTTARPYAQSEVDLFAFVAMDRRAILFMLPDEAPEQTLSMMPDDFIRRAARSLTLVGGWLESLAA